MMILVSEVLVRLIVWAFFIVIVFTGIFKAGSSFMENRDLNLILEFKMFRSNDISS